MLNTTNIIVDLSISFSVFAFCILWHLFGVHILGPLCLLSGSPALSDTDRAIPTWLQLVSALFYPSTFN